MEDAGWEKLLRAIGRGKCTPFIGAGASTPTLELGAEVAQRWADEIGYPGEQRSDLVQVAQYLAVKDQAMEPKDRIAEEITAAINTHGYPDFGDAREPHAALSRLPLSVFVTTNYDDFMTTALRAEHKDPIAGVCAWNRHITEELSQTRTALLPEPSVANPIVFHLHGMADLPESIVLTEDDYLEFTVKVAREQEALLPHVIRRALTGSSLLFVGYSLNDWTFKVILHSLIATTEPGLRRANLAVQLEPSDRSQVPVLESMLDERWNVKVHWASAQEFAAELNERWADYAARRRPASGVA